MTARVWIGIGTNVDDRASHLLIAREAMMNLPGTRLVAFSPAYETEPVGPVPQGRYLNAAAELETDLTPHDLLDHLQEIEQRTGRPPIHERQSWGPRTLDLDVLLFGQRVISSDRLVVPHPLMHERWFVLKPLADLAPDAVHPLLQMTVADLLKHVESQPPPPSNRVLGR